MEAPTPDRVGRIIPAAVYQPAATASAAQLDFAQTSPGEIVQLPTNSSLLSTHPRGSVELSPRVVSTLAARLAADCEGVAGMSGRGLRDGIAELLNRDNFERGVDLSLEEDGIRLDLFVIVEHGVRVLEVAHALMAAVAAGLEEHLGVRVLEVNVNVQGIRGREGGADGR
jgi:uncharacterized alkaline shock family protein YloU